MTSTKNAAANPFIEHPAEFTARNGGEQWLFRFPNGYGASVIRSHMSYGSDFGLWEIGVIGVDDRLDYSTPITSDVLGHQSDDDVREVLRAIAELPVAE